MAEIQDRWVHPGPQPNGMQAVEDGVWIIDQTDNYLYKLAYEDGSIMEKLPTETEHSSGVTVGGGHVWVASTYSTELFKVNASDGGTVAKYDTPGKGVVAFAADPAAARVTGAHGMEWTYRSATITGKLIRSPSTVVERSRSDTSTRKRGLTVMASRADLFRRFVISSKAAASTKSHRS